MFHGSCCKRQEGFARLRRVTGQRHDTCRAGLTAGLALLAACGPHWGFQVSAVRAGTNDSAIEGAKVRLVQCSEKATVIDDTDAAGRGQILGYGWYLPSECIVEVSKPGFESQQFRVGDFCPNPSGCASGRIKAELRPLDEKTTAVQ